MPNNNNNNEEEKGKDGSELVIFKGRFVTMNPTWPEASCVAVHQGRIVAVGQKMSDMKPWINRAGACGIVTRTELVEGVAFPGFIEPHSHPLVGGVALGLTCLAYHDTPNPWGEDIKGCKTKASALQRLQKENETLPAGKPLVCWGWDPVAMNGHLTGADLDAISKDRVIAVWDSSMHNGAWKLHSL
jgi:predicted amidohydrolase YtcJ